MKFFVTADQHFGDDRFKIMQRPFDNLNDMHETIVKNHNKVVGDNDEVICNGDIVYDKKCINWINHLAGKKILVRGNQDRQFSDAQLKPYFSEIIEEGGGIEREVGGIRCWITHYPTQSKGDFFNLVGHTHSAFKVALNMLCVCVDVHHFCPVNLDDIPFYFNAIKDFYDEDVWVAYHPVNMKYLNIRGKKGRYLEKA